VDNKGKWKSFRISDKINILAQVDARIGTYVELASRLRLSVSMLNTTVKDHGEIERRYVQYGFLQAAEVTEMFTTGETGICSCCWFKQTRESNASIDGTHLKEKALHITAHL
jgi:hypothetical protein